MKKGFVVPISLAMLFNVSIAHAGEPTYTYFYCDYKNKNDRVIFSRYSNLFFEANGGGRSSGKLIGDRKVRALLEKTEPKKTPSGLFLTKKSRVSCSSSRESEKSLGWSLYYGIPNQKKRKKGVDYVIIHGIDKKNDYLKSKNYKEYLLSPLIKINRNKLERMSGSKILSYTRAIN